MVSHHSSHTAINMHVSPTVDLRERLSLPAVSLTFAILASVFFALRIYAATKLTASIVCSRARVEHVLMGIGLVLMWGVVASVLIKAYSGIGLSKSQLSTDRQRLLNLGSWLVPKFWASSTACCKVSIILFLGRVVVFKPSVRAVLVLIALVTLVWALATILYTTLVCQPVFFYWDKSADGHCLRSHSYRTGNIVIAIFGMLIDIFLLVIPIPILWASRMRKSQKVAMTGVFAVGLIVVVFSLLRVVEFFCLDLDHISTSSGHESLWTVLENEFSVVCGCAPQLAPLFKSLRSSSKSGRPGYAGAYGTSNLGTHAKMSVIRTTVSGTTAAAVIVMPGLRGATRHARSSSELELKGIEVHTAIDQEISAESQRSHYGHSLTTMEAEKYFRI